MEKNINVNVGKSFSRSKVLLPQSLCRGKESLCQCCKAICLNENATLIKLLMKKDKTPNISSTYVICVDGSPMDWAARTPTGSPGSAQLEMKLSVISSLNSERSLCLWRPSAFFFFFGNFFRKSFSWLSKDSEIISKDVSLPSKGSLFIFSVPSLTPILCDKRA